MKALGKLDHEFLGSEFDWVAVDKDGAIGYFATAGAGWIPEPVLSDGEPFWNSLDIVISLPAITEVINRYSGSGHIVDWLNVAARGVFAFDWNHTTKRYELVASPKILLELEDAGDLASLANRTRLPCSFAHDFPPRAPT